MNTETASEDAIRLWLATLPCPECGGRGTHIESFPAGRDDVDCPTQGLALLWASKPCGHCGDSNWPGHCPLVKGQCTCLGVECNTCSGSGRVPKDVGLAEMFLVLAAPDGTYMIDVQTDWDCPHEFAAAGEAEDQHMKSPCDEATFACVVTRGRRTAYELFGQADGPVLNTDLLTLAALRAIAAQAKAGAPCES